MVNLRSRIFSDSWKMIPANYLAVAVGFAGTILIARILGPELTGITAASVTLALNYSIMSHLGALNALSQRYPFLMGKGTAESIDEAKKMPSIVLGFLFVGALILSLIIIWFGVYQIFYGTRLMAIGFFMAIILSILQLYKTYIFFYIRVTNQFQFWSKYTVRFAWVPLVWVLGAKLGSVEGQWLSMVGTEILMCFYLYKNVMQDIKIIFNIRSAWHYIKIGFPIFVVGSLYDFYMTTDRLSAAVLMGTTELGFYAIASLGCTFLGLIPRVVGQIMWPRMAEKMGEKEYTLSSIIPFIRKPLEVMNVLMAPLTGVSIIVIPILILVLMPRYTPAIVTAQILVISSYFIAIMSMYQTFLATSLKLLPYGIIILLGIVLNFVGVFISYSTGFEIEGIAFAKLFSFVFISLALIIYVERLFKQTTTELLVFLAKLLSPIVYVCIVVFIIIPLVIPTEFKNFEELLYVTSIQLLAMIILVAPMAWYGLNKTGMINDMKQHLSNKN